MKITLPTVDIREGFHRWVRPWNGIVTHSQLFTIWPKMTNKLIASEVVFNGVLKLNHKRCSKCGHWRLEQYNQLWERATRQQQQKHEQKTYFRHKRKHIQIVLNVWDTGSFSCANWQRKRSHICTHRLFPHANRMRQMNESRRTSEANEHIKYSESILFTVFVSNLSILL